MSTRPAPRRLVLTCHEPLLRLADADNEMGEMIAAELNDIELQLASNEDRLMRQLVPRCADMLPGSTQLSNSVSQRQRRRQGRGA